MTRTMTSSSGSASGEGAILAPAAPQIVDPCCIVRDDPRFLDTEARPVAEDSAMGGGDRGHPPRPSLQRRRSSEGAFSLKRTERTDDWRTGSRHLEDNLSGMAEDIKDWGKNGGESSEVGDRNGDESTADGDDVPDLGLVPAAQNLRRTHRRVAAPQIALGTSELKMVRSERFVDWASSFRRLDPRYGIRRCYDDVALWGAKESYLNFSEHSEMSSDEKECPPCGVPSGRAEEEAPLPPSASASPARQLPILLRMFKRAGVFTVWRPCRRDAINRMMVGEAVGKGLDIKGKSALKGELSGYVPFVQIHEEEDKAAVRTPSRNGRVRVYYRREEDRDIAIEALRDAAREMEAAVQQAREVLGFCDPSTSGGLSHSLSHSTQEERNTALRKLAWDTDDYSVLPLDVCGSAGGGCCHGVEAAERVVWEAFVVRRDIARKPGSGLDTGRASEPSFQDMNLASMRKEPKAGEPRPVVWQNRDGDPLCPQTLLVAYEEKCRVLPVVSDFDCFLVGTRGVSYDEPLPSEQVETLRWSVDHIERILDGPDASHGWATRWFNVLREEYGGKKKKLSPMPRFGYGDPRSYAVVEFAVRRLSETGAVRHGAECFNYYFPQDLDDEYLFVGDDDGPHADWKYVSRQELLELLHRKIDEGFTFPLNPKWILCDDGWKKLYDHLASSRAPHVARSLETWYPSASGVREKFKSICARHPQGFRRRAFDGLVKDESEVLRLSQLPSLRRHNSESMDLAIVMLERQAMLRRARSKIRGAVIWIRFLRALRAKKGQNGARGTDEWDAHESESSGEDEDEGDAPPLPMPSFGSRPSRFALDKDSPAWTKIGTDSVRLDL